MMKQILERTRPRSIGAKESGWPLRSASRRIDVFLAVIGFTLAFAQAASAAATVTYYYTSPQGTVLAKADAAGNIISNADYRPYGSQVIGFPEIGPGYSGHVNDPDSELVYMQARYYDPAAGRFLSRDPVMLKAGDSHGFNRYSYANDNPITNIDLDGRSSCPGQSKFVCIQSDTYNASRSAGETVQASPTVRAAMVSGMGTVSVSAKETKEKIGFIKRDAKGELGAIASTDATTSSSRTTDSATAAKPEDAVAVIHGHIDGRSDGVVSPADARPLAQGLPNGVVSEGRVGVTELVNGRLQFQMLEGRMSVHESDALQKSLDKQQLGPDFSSPEN